jgi:hypothetical protein
MHIYKFTHIETGRSYIGQTIQDHKAISKMLSNKTWKVIDGKRVWLDKEASV